MPTRKVALVTQVGTPTGRAVAAGLAEAGYDLAVMAPAATAERARLEHRVRRAGRRVRLLEADLDHPDGADRALAQVDDGFGRLDAVVTFPAPAIDGSRSVDEVLAPPFQLVRLCATRLRATSGSVVVCLGDAGDAATEPLRALTRALAGALVPHVRVNAVSPGEGTTAREADWVRAVLFVLASPHLRGEIVRVETPPA